VSLFRRISENLFTPVRKRVNSNSGVLIHNNGSRIGLPLSSNSLLEYSLDYLIELSSITITDVIAKE